MTTPAIILEEKAMEYLLEPRSCTELGEHLWGWSGRRVHRQSYARPAGKLIARLVREGKVVYAERATLARCIGDYWSPKLWKAAEEKP